MKFIGVLTLLVLALNCFGSTAERLSLAKESQSYIVQTKNQMNQQQMQVIRKKAGVVSFLPLVAKADAPFDTMYKIEVENKRDLLQLKSHFVKIEEIHSIAPFKNVKSKNSIFTSSIHVNNQFQPYLVKPPTGHSEKLVNDLFFNYQWGLYNQEPMIYNDQDDITSVKFQGVRGIDIGWAQARNLISGEKWKLNRDVVVAVIDYGVNVTHPDIEDNIYRNEKECNKGSIPRGTPKKDLDKNGYKGDCMGWNFTVPDTKNGKPYVSAQSNRPFDDTGHGTHVAGIIAAVSNNNLGVSGLSNRIKILPIKVIYKKETDELEDKIDSLTDRVAKGLEYAAKMNVDVINISMGWPVILQTDYLNKAFKKALDKGITIVAAIGNNEINKQIFPCALKGVFCVGSVDADGKISEFSNYGGHVDFMGPGDNILSLFPMTDVPITFSVQGYEIKSGTSQAAPFISGMAAVLKGVFPGISNDEIYGRLSATTQSVRYTDEKFTSGGLVNLAKAIKANSQPVVRPDFKEFSQIVYSYPRGDFEFEVPIKNYWQSTQDIDVFISSLGRHVAFNNSHFHIDSLGTGEVQTLKVKGRIRNFNSDSEYSFNVKVSGKSISSKTYKHTVLLTRSLKSDPKKVTFKLSGVSDITELRTVQNLDRSAKELELYTAENKEGYMQLSLFKRQGRSIVRTNQVRLDNALRLLIVAKADLNYDGREDFFVRVLSQKPVGDEKEYFIDYYYLDENLIPLFGFSHKQFEVIDRQILLDRGSLSFYKGYTRDKRPIALPIFQNTGSIPEKDRNPRMSARENLNPRAHIYYFELVYQNGQTYFEPRVFTNYKFDDMMRKHTGAKFYEELEPVSIFPQTSANFRNGAPEILFTIGQEYSRRYFKVKVRDPLNGANISEVQPFQNQFINVQDYRVLRFSEINSYGQGVTFNSGLNAVGFFNSIKSVSSFFNDNGLIHNLNAERSNKRDHFVNPIHSFKKGNNFYSFYLTKSKLYLNSSQNGRQAESEVFYSISAFLPGKIFRQHFYPIVVQSGREFMPGVYVDDTAFNGNHIFTRMVKDEKIHTPLKLDVHISDECRPLTPELLSDGGMYYSILCSDGNQNTLSLLPIEE